MAEMNKKNRFINEKILFWVKNEAKFNLEIKKVDSGEELIWK